MTHPPSFPRAGLTLLAQLSKNNSTAWFAGHRENYRTLVQRPALAIVEFVNAELRKFAPAYVTNAKSPFSRPNRDTRFSKDKSPYRTDVAVVFPRQGKEKHECAGFFFRIAPEGAELIAGAYMPGPNELKALRAYLARNHDELTRLLATPSLRREWGAIQGEQLKRVPKDYAPDHPAESLLRRTQLYLRRVIPREGNRRRGLRARHRTQLPDSDAVHIDSRQGLGE